MIATVRGRFTDVTGTVIVPDGDFSRAQFDATVGVASVDTREPQRDAHLKSPDFFEVDKYPTMSFRSRRVEGTSRDTNHYRLIGDLTLHGVTKEVVFDVTLEGITKDHLVRPIRIVLVELGLRIRVRQAVEVGVEIREQHRRARFLLRALCVARPSLEVVD